jgi:hypothetical protein
MEKSETPSTLEPKGVREADRVQWNEPRPETLPRPTYWPVALAFAITITAFGILTSLVLSVLGIALFIVAITMWIGEIRHEQND